MSNPSVVEQADARTCCVCVRVAPGRERIVALFSGPDAWGLALDAAPRYGTAADVTVDFYPPEAHGVTYRLDLAEAAE
jgi:hypothetical protein